MWEIAATHAAASGRRTVRCRVRRLSQGGEWQPVAALHIQNGQNLSKNVTVYGDLWLATDRWHGWAEVDRDAVYYGRNPLVKDAKVVPAFGDLSLVEAAKDGDLAYDYNGKRCTGQWAEGNQIDGSPIKWNSDNDGRVLFYKDKDGKRNKFLRFNRGKAEAPGNFAGTLVVLGVDLHVEKPIRMTPLPGMPALIVEHNVKMISDNLDFAVDGVAYLGGRVIGDDKKGGGINVWGSLISGTTEDTLASTREQDHGDWKEKRYNGTITMTWDPDKAAVPGFVRPGTSGSMAGEAAVEVLSWEVQE